MHRSMVPSPRPLVLRALGPGGVGVGRVPRNAGLSVARGPDSFGTRSAIACSRIATRSSSRSAAATTTRPSTARPRSSARTCHENWSAAAVVSRSFLPGLPRPIAFRHRRGQRPYPCVCRGCWPNWSTPTTGHRARRPRRDPGTRPYSDPDGMALTRAACEALAPKIANAIETVRHEHPEC